MEIETVRKHLNIFDNEYDELLSLYAESAEQAISNYLHKDFDSTNKVHNQAKLLLIGTWFENRESVVTGTIVNQLPHGINFLLDSDMSVAL